jgi:hypothetical protein
MSNESKSGVKAKIKQDKRFKDVEDTLITIQTEIIDRAVDVKNVVTEFRKFKKDLKSLDNGVALAMLLIVFVVITTLLFIMKLEKRIDELGKP